ncbi:MAG: hypothetical protein JWN40_1509 [Phycisphaerales bacterium]|nr:hypothetical protein [Phycisphaerales bacterium]
MESGVIGNEVRTGLVLLVWAVPALAADRAGPLLVPPAFAVVFIDAETEKALGPFPYDRAVYAKGIEENETPIGKVKGHRLFCYQLFSLYGELAGGQR